MRQEDVSNSQTLINIDIKDGDQCLTANDLLKNLKNYWQIKYEYKLELKDAFDVD